MTKQAIAKISVDAGLLIGALAGVEVGAEISYAALGAAIGRQVNGSSGALQTARNRLKRDHGIVFSPVVGQGLKRLSDVEKIGAAAAHVEAAHRTARRGMLILGTVVFEDLPAEETTRFHTAAAHLGTLEQMTTTRVARRIAARVEEKAQPLAIAEATGEFLKSLS